MKIRLASILLASPLLVGCIAGGYQPPGSFSYREPFPPMQPAAQPGAGEIEPAVNGWTGQPGAPTTAQNPALATHGTASENPARPLVGWDGGVVSPPAGGSITPADPVHGIGPSEQGRMHILELYQGVIDERDTLADEVLALRSELARRDEGARRTDGEVRALEERIAELEAAAAAQAQEVEDLLGRLTTAQIRRLEAEKLVLETKLAEFARAEEAAASAGDDR